MVRMDDGRLPHHELESILLDTAGVVCLLAEVAEAGIVLSAGSRQGVHAVLRNLEGRLKGAWERVNQPEPQPEREPQAA